MLPSFHPVLILNEDDGKVLYTFLVAWVLGVAGDKMLSAVIVGFISDIAMETACLFVVSQLVYIFL